MLLQLPKAAIGRLPARAAEGRARRPARRCSRRSSRRRRCGPAGVTYLRSRDAREEESAVKDVYTRVYEAKRPELFFKANGWRVAGHDMPIRVRDDSALERARAGADAGDQQRAARSSATPSATTCRRATSRATTRSTCRRRRSTTARARSVPGIHIGDTDRLKDLTIALEITRGGRTAFTGETRTSQIKRPLDELADYLFMELDFPKGAFLLTGTGIVPGQDFSLTPGDVVAITIGGADDITTMTLENEVAGKSTPNRAK